jgi:hypothetical protein
MSAERPSVVRSVVICCALVLSGMSATARAQGASTVYSDASSFLAAAQTVQTIGFKAPSPTTLTPATPYVDSTTGTSFSVPDGQFLYLVGSQFYQGTPYNQDLLVAATNSGGPVFINLPPLTTAVGLHYGGFAGGPFRFILSTGETFDIPAGTPLGTLGFIGFTSSTPITSIVVGTTAVDPIVIGDVLVGAPRCDIQLTRSTYTTGDTVQAAVFRLANQQAVSIPTEIKVWLGAPNATTTPVLNIGGDGSVILPAGFDANLGPISLFAVDDSFPKGSYEFSCRMIDLTSGRSLASSLNPFKIQ